MISNYEMAVAGLNEMDRQSQAGRDVTEAEAIGVIQIRASLAAADSNREVLKALETSNLLAYAQLCSTVRDGAKFTKARRAAERAMKGTLQKYSDDQEDF